VALKCSTSETIDDDEGDILSGFETLKVCTVTIIKVKKIAHSHITSSQKCDSSLQEFGLETRFNRYDNL
jgi:hypothetical protein